MSETKIQESQMPETRMPETQQQRVSVRQNFHDESESVLNDLINMLFFGAYTCKSMAYYFDRDDIGMFGMADFNRYCARDSYHLAKILMDYIVVRGGEVEFDDIKKPERNEWGTPLESLEYLLNIKQTLNKLVLKCHKVADDKRDPHLTDFLETEILRPLVVFIRKCGVLISNVKRAGPNLGEYQFNKDLEKSLKEFMKETRIPTSHRIPREVSSKVVPRNISFKDLSSVVDQIVETISHRM